MSYLSRYFLVVRSSLYIDVCLPFGGSMFTKLNEKPNEAFSESYFLRRRISHRKMNTFLKFYANLCVMFGSFYKCLFFFCFAYLYFNKGTEKKCTKRWYAHSLEALLCAKALNGMCFEIMYLSSLQFVGKFASFLFAFLISVLNCQCQILNVFFSHCELCMNRCMLLKHWQDWLKCHKFKCILWPNSTLLCQFL